MKLKRVTYCLVSMLMTSKDVLAQSPPGPGPPPPHPELPIDGGLAYLLLGGVLIGAYYIKQKKPS
jgi:hypothetical protein